MARKPQSGWLQLQRKSAALRRRFEQLAREFTELASVEDSDVIRGSALAKVEIEKWRQVLDQTIRTSQDTSRTMQQRASDVLECLEEHLVRAIREAGLNVYGETSLLVVEGTVHVKIDGKKASTRINDKAVGEMTVNGLTTAIIAELQQVQELITPPEKFLPLLLRAYEMETLQTAKDFGSQVQTSALLCQLAMLRQQTGFRSNPIARNFRGYPREVFRADLFRLLESNLTSASGKRFRYASGSDTAGAVFMFVPQLGRTAHIGRIWFEHDKA